MPSPKNFYYDKDSGYAELVTRFRGPGASVFVGFLQSSGVYKSKGESGGEPITVAQVAAIHEFGSADGRIPQRSFMGSTIDKNDSKLRSLVGKLAGKIVDGKITEVTALGTLGQIVKDMFRAAITKGLKPPVTAATQRRKGPGKTKALIDTGQLIGSISFEVRRNGK